MVTYDLLHEEQFGLAKALLDFAVITLKKYSSEHHRRVFIINRAQAYKWNGENALSLLAIEKEDWSACEQKFKLAVAVLKDDFAAASALMQRERNSEEINRSTENGPCSKNFVKRSNS